MAKDFDKTINPVTVSIVMIVFGAHQLSKSDKWKDYVPPVISNKTGILLANAFDKE